VAPGQATGNRAAPTNGVCGCTPGRWRLWEEEPVTDRWALTGALVQWLTSLSRVNGSGLLRK
jgi:hypothetical protein